MDMALADYLLEIVEGLDTQHAQDGHSDCRKCLPSREGGYQPTWTIRLLTRCPGGCGCVIQLDHIGAVHDSSGAGDWEGTYTSPSQIVDPALRRYAEALLAGNPPQRGRPPYPPASASPLTPDVHHRSEDPT
ncbi:hypothetical protein [Nonomuraea sp. 10N515B]|uniref:hypothetical protein n=1 Tax=Nonomuraea sp. 10N515B TaxID=3457422 RepID=UPI003FCD9AF3